MICPHCKKPIKREHSDELKKQAIALYKEGYSLRDIEVLLERRCHFGTIAKWVKDAKLTKVDKAIRSLDGKEARNKNNV